MEKSNKSLIKLTIYMVAFILLGMYAISPAMSSISAAMPERSATEIQMILQLPALMSVPFLLFGGIISQKISRKTLILFGLVCYTAGGTTGFFTSSYTVILLSRCVLGLGIGIMNPCTMGLISDLFYGTEDYAPTVGIENASKSIGGVVGTMITGALCTISWHHTFLIYFLGVPIFLFMLFFVPGMKAVPSSGSQDNGEKGNKTDILKLLGQPTLLLVALLSFMTSYSMNITNGNISYLIEGGGFGNSTLAGFAASIFTLFCVVGSWIFARITNKLGKKAILYGIVMAGFGMLLSGVAPNVLLACLGVAILGTGAGIINPAQMMLVGNIDQQNAAFYFSVVLSAMNLGSTCQGATVPTIAAALFGGTGVGAHAYLVGAIGFVITFIWGVFVVSRIREPIGSANGSPVE